MPNYVVLDRIEPDEHPSYCVHGRATCVGGCGEWVWLGDATYKVVHGGQALPLCIQCAQKYCHPSQRIGHVNNHERKDGPH